MENQLTEMELPNYIEKIYINVYLNEENDMCWYNNLIVKMPADLK